LDIRIFENKAGGVVQLIDKDKMKDWPIELPLIFIEYIRNEKLSDYKDKDVKKKVEQYLDEILKDVAIPGLINVLDGEKNEEIISALKRIEEIAKKKIDMVKPIKPYIENLSKNKNKEIINLSSSIKELFSKAERRKNLEEKRKLMQKKEKEFLDGKISGQEYAKIRKEYLILRD
jgi:hypothetical protein